MNEGGHFTIDFIEEEHRYFFIVIIKETQLKQ